MASPLFEDTIAAVATAPGRGAIALLRVSGGAARPVLLRVCPELGSEPPPPRTQRLVDVRHPATGELLDRALVSWFPAPASYTGDDTAEISVHGGPLGPQLVLDALLAAGARAAQPGEFSRRAVFNGKMDLLQAEAVADLIDGRSPAFRRAAVSQMERSLSRRVAELRDAVVGLEALVAYGIDFPDEDEPPVSPERVRAAAADALSRIEATLSTPPRGEMLRDGALAVLAGRPNSGKSSLFNSLLGFERAIVTDVPGTTRDALEATITLDGYPFRLVDTAGLRQSEDRVESIGIEVARRYLDAADVVLLCVELGRDLDSDERAFVESAGAPLLLLRTKADLIEHDLAGPAGESDRDGNAIRVSVVSGEGIASLSARLVELAFGGLFDQPDEQPVVTRLRHARALRAAAAEVRHFLDAQEQRVPPELAATHLRSAAGALEELIGAVTPDDVLGGVFSSFCVGK